MIPTALGLLKTLCIYMIAGCEELEISLGLMHGGSSILNGFFDALEVTEAAFNQSVTAVSDAYKNLKKQDALATAFIKDAAKVLRAFLGERWSQNGWPETGFPNQSTAVPRTFAERMLLCRSLELYFKAHKARENAKMTVTEERAGDLYEAMKQAGKDVIKAEAEQDKKRSLRDDDLDALRGAMEKLENELALVLSSSDPRWKKFGLEIPDAPSTPAAPQNVTVDTSIPGKWLIRCDPGSGVNIYRFFQQTDGEPEPRLVDKSYEPMLLMDRPAAGAVVKLFVSVKNLAGRESERSTPAEVKAAA